MTNSLPTLPEGWEPTRATLHAYALSVGSIPRTHALPHPKWWHLSLEVRPDGLVTDPIPLPDGGALHLRMDLRFHAVVLETSHGDRETFPMTDGLTATELADRLIGATARYGLDGEYARAKFESDDDRIYDTEHAEVFFATLVEVDRLFAGHRNSLEGSVGPIQVWPHGFDLAFEWFGTRSVTHGEAGAVEEHPSQLNLGFYPAGDAYFYSNPWPFESDRLLGEVLPGDASWHTDGWEGSILPYETVAGKPEGREQVADYARAVFDAASPTLTAD